MDHTKDIIKEHSLKIALPTITMSIVALVCYALFCTLAVLGQMNVNWVLLLNTILAYVLFTSMHEAAHINISGKKHSIKWMNELIGWLSGLTLLAPFYLFRIIHFRHHAFTNDPEKDPDHWLASKNLISLLFHSSTIFPMYIFKGLQLLCSEEKITKKVKRDLRTSYFVLFLFFLLFLAAGIMIGWTLVLKIWILPALIAQVFLAISFDWLPHHPHDEQDRYLNTRVIDIPGLSFLLLGQNYHLIHHLYPRIPFYDYKTIYSKIQGELKEKGVEVIEAGNRG